MNPRGLDVVGLLQHKYATGAVKGFPDSEAVIREEVLELPCDILVPAALEGQITAENAPRLQAKIVAEAANHHPRPQILRSVVSSPADILWKCWQVVISVQMKTSNLQSLFAGSQEQVYTNCRKHGFNFHAAADFCERARGDMRMAAKRAGDSARGETTCSDAAAGGRDLHPHKRASRWAGQGVHTAPVLASISLSRKEVGGSGTLLLPGER
jgi:glutamate dehydrogenase (NAD(P)+)